MNTHQCPQFKWKRISSSDPEFSACECYSSVKKHGLRPCPMCGPSKSIVELVEHDYGFYAIHCGACALQSGHVRQDRLDELFASWNSRPVEDCYKALAVFMTHCHMEWHDLRHKAISPRVEDCRDFLTMNFPVIQGTTNQINLKKIGGLPYEQEAIHQAIELLLTELKQ